MKKFYSIKYLSIILGLSFTPLNETQACGPTLFSSDTKFSLLSTQTIENDALVPFSYHPHKHRTYTNDGLYLDREKNIQEWVDYGKGAYQNADVLHIQYNTSADSFLNIAQNNNWSIFEDNEWILWMSQSKKHYVRDYMIYAKKIEQMMKVDAWGYWSEENKKDLKRWPELIEEGLALLKKNKKDKFIKERIAFQVIKCAYYNSLYNDDEKYNSTALNLYKNTLSKSNSIVAHWVLIYVSDLEKDPLRRTQYLLEAFDKSDEKKQRAISLMNIEDVRRLYNTTTDKYFKEISLVILNINNVGRGLDDIKTLYNLNPNSTYIKLMINREVNKLEEWIWSHDNLLFWPESFEKKYFGQVDYNDPQFNWDSYYQDYSDKLKVFEKWAINNRVEDIKYAIEVRDYLNTVLNDDKIKKGYMQLVVAHLYSLTKDYKQAEKILKNMNPAQKDPIVTQYHYEKNIIMLETYDMSTQRSKDLFTMSLLGIHNTNKPKLKFRYYQDYDNSDTGRYKLENKHYAIDPQFFVYIGNKLIEKGLRAEGALFLASSKTLRNEYAYSYDDMDPYNYGHISVLEKYVTPEDVDVIINLSKKPYPNLFEQFMLPLTMANEELYLDLKGTLYLRQKNYEKALETFNQISDDFWEKNYYFSEYLPTLSVTELPAYMIPNITTGNGHQYKYVSKKEIVKEIIDLQNTIDTAQNPKTKVQAQLYLANAMYNISYYGSAWMTFAYGKSIHSEYKSTTYDSYKWAYYSVPENAITQLDNFYELKDAIKLYGQVLNEPAATTEQKALATAMIMKCNQHADYYTYGAEYNYNHPSILSDKAQANKQILKSLQQYSQTAVYKSLKTHCPDF